VDLSSKLPSGPGGRWPDTTSAPTLRRLAFGLALSLLPATPAATGLVRGAAGAEPSWSLVASPNGDVAPTELSSVACVSPSDCWAVGNTQDEGFDLTMLLMNSDRGRFHVGGHSTRQSWMIFWPMNPPLLEILVRPNAFLLGPLSA